MNAQLMTILMPNESEEPENYVRCARLSPIVYAKTAADLMKSNKVANQKIDYFKETILLNEVLSEMKMRLFTGNGRKVIITIFRMSDINVF